MVAKNPTISLESLINEVSKLSPVVDVALDKSCRFEVVGEERSTSLVLAGRPVTSTVLYQVSSATSSEVDIRGFRQTINRARSSNEKAAAEGRARMQYIADGLNTGLNGRDLSNHKLIMRTAKDERGVEYVGGVVSGIYTPMKHLDLLAQMNEHPAFDGAQVVKWKADQAHLNFTLLMNGQKWEVDGGLKNGVFGANGQFGDTSANLWAMLYRLLCTNGMMTVEDKAGFRARHVGGVVDLEKRVADAVDGAARLFESARAAMSVECDVVDLLSEAYVRGHINRGQFKKTLDRRNEVFGGRQVEGAESTLWGASQALTAAARDYSISSGRTLQVFAGKLVTAGEDYQNVVNSRAVKADITDLQEILSPYGLAA